jgi:hypothetical protein
MAAAALDLAKRIANLRDDLMGARLIHGKARATTAGAPSNRCAGR